MKKVLVVAALAAAMALVAAAPASAARVKLSLIPLPKAALSEFLFVGAGAIGGNDVKNVAQNAVSRIDAVLGG